jgi:hypothetical protein
MNKNDVWERYRRGDLITDHELEVLLKDTKRALDSLVYRSDYGVVTRALAADVAALEGYQRARKLRSSTLLG